jgi:hypothetical protein
LCDKPRSTTHQSRQDRAFGNAVLCKTKNKSYILPPSKTGPKHQSSLKRAGTEKQKRENIVFSSEGRRVQPKMLEVIELILLPHVLVLSRRYRISDKSMSNEGGSQKFSFLS